MKKEMDFLKMSDLQRICWLKANRATLIAVGLVWIGMIAKEILYGNTPWFLIVMVPVFAFLRMGFYWYYKKKKSR